MAEKGGSLGKFDWGRWWALGNLVEEDRGLTTLAPRRAGTPCRFALGGRRWGGGHLLRG